MGNVVDVKRTVEMGHHGKEGLLIDKEGKTIYDDSWMHPEIEDPQYEDDMIRGVQKMYANKDMGKSLYIDLEKAHMLHKEKLVRRMVQVQGHNGRVFYRMQWVDPHTGKPPERTHAPEESSGGRRGFGKRFEDEPTPQPQEHKDVPKAKEDKPKEQNKGGQSIVVSGSDHFDNVIKKRYPKEHIINEALRQGITWNRKEHPAMDWMRAAVAIKNHLDMGGHFEIQHDKGQVNDNLKEKGKNELDGALLDLIEKHGGKQQLMEWAQDNGIGWKEHSNVAVNWMRAAMAIKQHLAEGHSTSGVRVQKKEFMDKANLLVSTDIKQTVSKMGADHGKEAIMNRALEYGISWTRTSKDGKPLPLPMDWMRCATAIQEHIASGKEFTPAGEINKNGVTASSTQVGPGIKLSKYQSFAIDFAGRNVKNYEERAEQWGLAALAVDRKGFTPEQCKEFYDKLKEGASKSKIMVHFDPFQMVDKNTNLLEQMSTDGKMRNPYEMGIEDPESLEVNERDLFSDKYDEASSKERPVYGNIDLYNQGLKSSRYGGIAFVLKDGVRNRATVTYTDSNSLPWESNGKFTRLATHAHQALVDKWTSRWAKPNKQDMVRVRAMNSVAQGTRNNDEGFFEAQIHGGVDFKRDIDHILIPQDWNTNPDHKDKHSKIKEFAKLHGLDIKYEE